MAAPATMKEALAALGAASLRLPANQQLVLHAGNSYAIEECARWVFRSHHYGGDLNRGILLRGPKGTGKTHLMRVLAYILTPHGFKTVKCDDVVKEFNDSTRTTTKAETRSIGGDHVIEYYANLPRICFDDLGDERMGKYYGETCNVLERILTRRGDLMAMSPMLTMFTTNLEAEDTELKYGERVRDRMALMARAIVVEADPDPKALPFRAQAKVMDWRAPVEAPAPPTARSEAAAKIIEDLANRKNERTKQRIAEEQEGKARYIAGFVGRARKMELLDLIHAIKEEPYDETRAIARREFDSRSPVGYDDLVTQAQTKLAST